MKQHCRRGDRDGERLPAKQLVEARADHAGFEQAAQEQADDRDRAIEQQVDQHLSRETLRAEPWPERQRRQADGQRDQRQHPRALPDQEAFTQNEKEGDVVGDRQQQETEERTGQHAGPGELGVVGEAGLGGSGGGADEQRGRKRPPAPR